jgi:hypothetical protein
MQRYRGAAEIVTTLAKFVSFFVVTAGKVNIHAETMVALLTVRSPSNGSMMTHLYFMVLYGFKA